MSAPRDRDGPTAGSRGRKVRSRRGRGYDRGAVRVSASMDVTVETCSGVVRGVEIAEGLVFRGVPYAAPPVGERRFAAPERIEAWRGVRECTAFGPAAPTMLGGGADVVASED